MKAFKQTEIFEHRRKYAKRSAVITQVLVTEVSGWEKWLHTTYQSLMESAGISAPGTKKTISCLKNVFPL
jgi:hypothetical protein